MSATPCPCCGCGAASGAHEVAAALAADDLDRAMSLGLLSVAPCPSCSPACTAALEEAKARRLHAFAARERFRNRQARLQRISDERKARRAAAAGAAATSPGRERPPLPGAAAAALARAKAKAAERGR